jgi:Ankyrin repeats (3 copies)
MQLKDAVVMAADEDTSTEDVFLNSWKGRSGLGRQNTIKLSEETLKANPKPILSHSEASRPSSRVEASTQAEPATQPGQETSAPKFGAHMQEHEALLIAAEKEHVNAVERLTKKGVDVNAIAGDHGHALATAAYHGREEVVKTLIRSGANVNLLGGKCGFALHAAAQQGHSDVVKVLLGRGANVQVQGGQFRFALTAGERSF